MRRNVSISLVLTAVALAVTLAVFSSAVVRLGRAQEKPLRARSGAKGCGKAQKACPGPFPCPRPGKVYDLCQHCTSFSFTLPENANLDRGVEIECWATKPFLPKPEASWFDDDPDSPNSRIVRYVPCDVVIEDSRFADFGRQGYVVSGNFQNWSDHLDRWAEIWAYYYTK